MILTAPQRAVLEWLLAYPGIYVSYFPGMTRGSVNWTASWASEGARQHMVYTMGALGGGLVGGGSSDPRAAPKGGTPRITYGTFAALARRDLIRPELRERRQHGSWYFQISRAGIAAIAEGAA